MEFKTIHWLWEYSGTGCKLLNEVLEEYRQESIAHVKYFPNAIVCKQNETGQRHIEVAFYDAKTDEEYISLAIYSIMYSLEMTLEYVFDVISEEYTNYIDEYDLTIEEKERLHKEVKGYFDLMKSYLKHME